MTGILLQTDAFCMLFMLFASYIFTTYWQLKSNSEYFFYNCVYELRQSLIMMLVLIPLSMLVCILLDFGVYWLHSKKYRNKQLQ